MNSHIALEHILNDILEVIKPLREDWAARSKIIEELKEAIASVESFRGATVEPFGSFVSNLFTRWGDLDISIVLSNDSYISSAARKRKQNLLAEFLSSLRQKGGYSRFQFVPNARVPILKFESGCQNISCDVSIDNLHGRMKSNFLIWINQIDGRFRDMVLLVKEWTKAHNINNPKTGTLNSYSLCLLVIFHFQTCVPAILPPLRKIYPRSVIHDLTGVRIAAEERVKEICNANISRFMADKNRAVNRSSLSELFVSFLAKFSDISSKAVKFGICTFTGQWQDIRSNTRWQPKTYALFIEDPFEQPENTARAVSSGNIKRISEAFQITYHRLVLANTTRASLLGILVRPDILNSVAGTAVRNLSYAPMSCQTTRQQISTATCSSSQVQHQFQNLRLYKHPNSFTKQRSETHPHTSNSQHPAQKTRVEKHPNLLVKLVVGKQTKETHPHMSNSQHPMQKTRVERHPNHLVKQVVGKQGKETHPGNFSNESNPNTLTRQKPAQKYYGQGQGIWRPKFDAQGKLKGVENS